MIVTCPECATRYLVDPRALGTSGRTVRCANCANTWHQTPPDDAPPRLEPPRPALEPLTIERPEARIQLPVVARPRRRSGLRAVGWIAAVLVLFVLGAGLVAEKGRILALWPASAALYETVGLGSGATGQKFSVRITDTQNDRSDDQSTIVVIGEVVNLTAVTQPAPKVKVSLNDADEHELLAWVIPLTDEHLLPGQTVTFRTTSSRPPGAVAVSAAIVDGG
jgi:predicted Zn finger-like uncharacterized protein